MGRSFRDRLQNLVAQAQGMKTASGSIVLIDLGAAPFGHEQAGLRPAVVLSVTNGMAIVVPLTSNTASLRFSATLPVGPTKRNGLATSSVALAFHIRSVDARRVVKHFGNLDSKDARALNKLVRSITSAVR
jgi:mRNA-degrading endonuclease toxin of MazEF toxin-antitoxin module